MHDQQVLHLLRVDVHPTRDNHERRSVGEIEVSVIVDVTHVAQRAPAPVVGDRRGLRGVLEVLEIRTALEEQFAGLTHRQFDSVFPEHMHGAERLADG